ncbi:MAG TPA: outer envelope protein [Burkholderiaceae bacterium]
MKTHAILAAALLALGTTATQAADWSDTALGYRHGSSFAEPFNTSDISKNIFSLTHASGYKYGSNFFNVDMLLSDKNDPASVGSTQGAHEVYAVYRHTLDLEKATGTAFKVGPFRGWGLTAGFDLNTKTDAGYNSKKRMLVLGPTLMVDVPGFLNISLLLLQESNAPFNGFSQVSTPRYTYKTHPMLGLVWGMPVKLGSVPLSFEGYANFIASKGRNEFGVATATETNIDMQLMVDCSGGRNTFRLGVEYQYWRNKFGNAYSGPAGNGAFAKTPMLRAEYHF